MTLSLGWITLTWYAARFPVVLIFLPSLLVSSSTFKCFCFLSHILFFPPLITVTLFGLAIQSKSPIVLKPSSTSFVGQVYIGTGTIQLQLLDGNLDCLLWLLGGKSTLPKWSSSICLQMLPHISPSFSLTQLLTITLAPPHLLSLIFR